MASRPLLIVLAATLALGQSAATGDPLTAAAGTWLSSLDPAQRGEVLYAFEDDERFDLRLAPLWLEGLRRDGLSDAQWAGWRDVLATALSPAGLAKVERIISLEREVRERDRRSWGGRLLGGFVHGEQRYYIALFGDPREGHPWGVRFDGHHLSLNWTVAPDGAVSLTPVFMGSEPREVPAGWERAGLRGLPDEEDTARALWATLRPGQRADAELPFSAASGPAGGNRPLFLGEGARVERTPPRGIARGALRPDQAAALDALVEVYLSNYAPELAAARRAAIDAAGRDALHFAYAGSLEPGRPGYYRIHGPSLLIEYDNTVAEADHVHTLVREFDGDFGRDLLAEHHAHAHPVHSALR